MMTRAARTCELSARKRTPAHEMDSTTPGTFSDPSHRAYKHNTDNTLHSGHHEILQHWLTPCLDFTKQSESCAFSGSEYRYLNEVT